MAWESSNLDDQRLTRRWARRFCIASAWAWDFLRIGLMLFLGHRRMLVFRSAAEITRRRQLGARESASFDRAKLRCDVHCTLSQFSAGQGFPCQWNSAWLRQLRDLVDSDRYLVRFA